jgi:SAM-dependent methyltransferase
MNQQPDRAETLATQFDRFARFYDADYRHYQEDINLILDLADQTGDPILELGCGTGRVLLPLLDAGHTVTGVDISPALLGVAAEKMQLANYESRCTLHKADLRTFDLPDKTFAFAFCTSNTLMHLATQQDQLTLLRNVYRHLRPGGLLLIDLFNPDVARLNSVNGLLELADQWHDPITGAQVFKWSVRTVDWTEQLQETLFTYEEILPDGATRRTACPFTIRFLWRGEAELLLQSAGFTVEEVCGDFDGAPYSAASDHLILLAAKTE